MGKNFYISDTHIGHSNAILYDQRPFASIEEMEEEIVRRWNGVVTNEDHVYILGDFCWGTEPKWIELLPKLNGQKTLIQGNHDIIPSKSRRYFADVKEYKVINDGWRKVVLCHYPIPCFRNHHYGWYHLYGHVHATEEFKFTEMCKDYIENKIGATCWMYNVGAMMPYIDYTPRTLDEIIEGYEEWKSE